MRLLISIILTATLSLFITQLACASSNIYLNLHAEIERAAKAHSISPLVIAAIAKIESNSNVCALSHKGARGIMQFMPSTAVQMDLHDPFSPSHAIHAGARHLSDLLKQGNGDHLSMAAMYNAGASYKNTPYYHLPPETQGYIIKFVHTIQRGKQDWKILIPEKVLVTSRAVCNAIHNASSGTRKKDASLFDKLAFWKD